METKICYNWSNILKQVLLAGIIKLYDFLLSFDMIYNSQIPPIFREHFFHLLFILFFCVIIFLVNLSNL